MPTFGLFVQVGRICLINRGKDEGKLCTIVNVIDGNHALVQGPQIKRKAVNFKRLHLTKLVLKMTHQDSATTVAKLWKEQDVDGKWSTCTWAKRLQAKSVRESMTDFDRFKLMKAKRARNRLLRAEMNKLKKMKNSKK